MYTVYPYTYPPIAGRSPSAVSTTDRVMGRCGIHTHADDDDDDTRDDDDDDVCEDCDGAYARVRAFACSRVSR